MDLNPSVESAPASEPVTLVEAKLHLRIDHTFEDAYITQLIQEAREFAEGLTGRRFITQTLLFKMDYFSDWEIVLPEAVPLASVTSVKYYDTDGVLQTLSTDAYRVNLSRHSIEPAYGYSWPSVYTESESVEIRYVVGSAASSVPAHVKRGMLLLIGHWYTNREADVSIPLAAYSIFRRASTGEYV